LRIIAGSARRHVPPMCMTDEAQTGPEEQALKARLGELMRSQI
jgi:hypothetical protein